MNNELDNNKGETVMKSKTAASMEDAAFVRKNSGRNLSQHDVSSR